MRPSIIGLFTGLLLGLALVLTSFPEMLVVALFAGIGFVAAKVAAREVDLGRYLGGRGDPQP